MTQNRDTDTPETRVPRNYYYFRSFYPVSSKKCWSQLLNDNLRLEKNRQEEFSETSAVLRSEPFRFCMEVLCLHAVQPAGVHPTEGRRDGREGWAPTARSGQKLALRPLGWTLALLSPGGCLALSLLFCKVGWSCCLQGLLLGHIHGKRLAHGEHSSQQWLIIVTHVGVIPRDDFLGCALEWLLTCTLRCAPPFCALPALTAHFTPLGPWPQCSSLAGQKELRWCCICHSEPQSR